MVPDIFLHFLNMNIGQVVIFLLIDGLTRDIFADYCKESFHILRPVNFQKAPVANIFFHFTQPFQCNKVVEQQVFGQVFYFVLILLNPGQAFDINHKHRGGLIQL